ncbi:MAG: RNA polymerase sigma factor [Anaeromyxobacter sp.]
MSGRPATVVPLTPPASLAERDDDALMELAAADHPAAFEVLAHRHAARLARYCAKFLGDVRAGEDVAQDVLVEVWRARHRYQGRGRFQVFLLTLARNRCRNAIRDEGRRWTAADGAAATPALRPDDPGQLEELLRLERERKVRAALGLLPEKLREAVLLRFDQGLAYADIARLVHRPEVTVRSRVFHGLKRLRQALGEKAP